MSYTLEEFAELLDDIKNELIQLNEHLGARPPKGQSERPASAPIDWDGWECGDVQCKNRYDSKADHSKCVEIPF